MISFIFIILTIFLNNILSNILPYSYQDLSLFFPMLSVVSLIIIYFFIKDKYIYIIISSLIGLITDFLYNNIFINTFIYFILALIIIIFYKKRKLNFLNIIICSIIILFAYDSLFFINLIVLDYGIYKIDNLIYKISCSLITNILYVLISYFILNKSLKKTNKL